MKKIVQRTVAAGLAVLSITAGAAELASESRDARMQAALQAHRAAVGGETPAESAAADRPAAKSTRHGAKRGAKAAKRSAKATNRAPGKGVKGKRHGRRGAPKPGVLIRGTIGGAGAAGNSFR